MSDENEMDTLRRVLGPWDTAEDIAEIARALFRNSIASLPVSTRRQALTMILDDWKAGGDGRAKAPEPAEADPGAQ